MRTKKADWSQLWKRNAVVAAIALFVCAAVYLNWSYGKDADAGKTLGQSTMVGGRTDDPLVKGDSSTAADAPSTAAAATSGPRPVARPHKMDTTIIPVQITVMVKIHHLFCPWIRPQLEKHVCCDGKIYRKIQPKTAFGRNFYIFSPKLSQIDS